MTDVVFTQNVCNRSSIWPAWKEKKWEKPKLCLPRDLPEWRSKCVCVCVCEYAYMYSLCVSVCLSGLKEDCRILYYINAFIHTTTWGGLYIFLCVFFFFSQILSLTLLQVFSIFHVWDVNQCKLKHRALGSCRVGTDTIYSQSLVFKGHFHSYILLLLPDRWMLTQQCFSVQLLYMHEMRALSVYRSSSLLQPI